MYLRSIGGTGDVLLQTSGGNVGIGTTSPNRLLHLNTSSGTNGRIQFTNATTGTGNTDGFFIGQDGGNGNVSIWNYENNYTRFATNNTERMRIDSSGRLLVGATSTRNVAGGVNPKLQVEGTGTGSSTTAISITQNSNNTTAPTLSLTKSRATAVGGVTIVQDDDPLGRINFSGADGTDANSTGARIEAAVDGTPGSNDMPGRLVFSTCADNASSPTERMRIDSSGRLLLGTTTHSAVAQTIYSTENSAIIFQNSNTGTGSGNGFYVGASTGTNAYVWNYENSAILFATHNTERMRIDNAGNLRIGQTTSSQPAADDVRGVAIQGTGVLSACNTGARAIEIGRTETDSNSREVLRWFRNGNLVQTITTTSTTVNYPTGSDYRLKENVIEMTGAIDRVKQLTPKRFNFIAEPGVERDGFIAHELETVVPQAVVGTKDQVDENGNPVWQGVDHSFMVPLLTGALQEAIAKIETLEAKVAALEAQ